ncbi:MAG: leucine-rich repeat protein [Prevotella sp.]|nr:leucine-rich repeat protein [Prevotella sp.]
MNYPLISEYIEAIKSAEDNFKELTNLRPVLGYDGLPIMNVGGFSVVFKMKDERDGKFYALKCFTKEQEGRAEAYRQITEELKNVESSYLVSIHYCDKELYVDTKQTTETEFPVLLMDWVEGQTLDKKLRGLIHRCLITFERMTFEHFEYDYDLQLLTYRFSHLAMWLKRQPFAHGDLKPENILVREDGSLVLVDYDGMYVPIMNGQKARELGSPDYRHPSRTEVDFNEHIDDFPLVSILLSLKAIALKPELLEQYGASDRLLFSAQDYHDISQCALLKELYPSHSSELNIIIGMLSIVLEKTNLKDVSYKLLCIDRPIVFGGWSFEVTKEYIVNAWTDEFGATYSPNGKELLEFSSYDYNTERYQIKKGTEIICDLAFNNFENDNHFLKGVSIPSSVIAIGENPFAGCIDFEICNESPHFKMEDGFLYDKSYERLISYTNPSSERLSILPSIKYIGAYSMSFCFANYIELPKMIESIGEFAFAESEVKCILIPSFVHYVGKRAFLGCKKLTDVILLCNWTAVDPSSFDDCENLKHVFVLPTVINYYEQQFSNLKNKLVSIGNNKNVLVKKENVEEIYRLGESYWRQNDYKNAVKLFGLAAVQGLKKATKEIINFGGEWHARAIYSDNGETFEGNFGGIEYEIREGTKYISEGACFDMMSECDCNYLSKLIIPNSIISIGDYPFGSYMSEVICYSPNYIVDNKTLYSKDKRELIQCFNHESEVFIIPEGVEVIRKFAFYSCPFKKIIIPSSIKEIGANPFIETGVVWNKSDPYNNLDIISHSNTFFVSNNCLCEGNRLISYWGNDIYYEVLNGVQLIDNNAFWRANVKRIILPNSIKKIGKDAFCWSERLEYIIVPCGAKQRFKTLLPSYLHDKLLEDNDLPF